MTLVNYSKREVAYKVVLLGVWGRETPLVEALYNGTAPEGRGKLTALGGQAGKVLFFDFLPGDTPPVRGFKIRLHVYGWAGEAPAEADLKLLLKGADGAVLFGNPASSGTFVKSLLEEEKIPWVEGEEDTDPAEKVEQIIKEIVPTGGKP